MNKTLSVERIFSLGDYQNIKFTDSITEIPEAVLLNSDAVKLLRYLQLIDIEWAYTHYTNLRLRMPKILKPEDVEAALAFVEEERTKTFEQLLATIQNKE
jgi:hypothetical protein